MQSNSVFPAFSQIFHGTYRVLNTIKQPQTKYWVFFPKALVLLFLYMLKFVLNNFYSKLLFLFLSISICQG